MQFHVIYQVKGISRYVWGVCGGCVGDVWVCAGVRGCEQVCAGVCKCAQVGVRGWTRVCVGVGVCRGRGPRGARGARAPLKIGDLFSKILEKDIISFFFLLGPPLEKDRSSAPAYEYYNLTKFG